MNGKSDGVGGGDKPIKSTVKIDAERLLDLQRFASTRALPKQKQKKHAKRSVSPSQTQMPHKWRSMFEARYRLGRIIGEGGMGVVHEAFDRAIGRLVAIKLLKEPLEASKEEVYKLVREIQITGQLEHPNIMPIYDVGVLEDGRLFFVMKLIHGKNLRDIIYDELGFASGSPSYRHRLRKLVEIFRIVCLAVEFAHSKGVIHRDLKPENVMVGDFGEVLVLDWGLAKIKEFDEPFEGVIKHPQKFVRAVSVRKTLDGSIIGTPCYMSPEQAQGKIKEVDERSDVFGLGAILYEILACNPPIVGSDQFEVIAKAAVCDIKPPSEVSPDFDIPAELEDIAMKALAERKERRYQSVAELLADIERFLEGSLEVERKKRESQKELEEGKQLLEEYNRLRNRLEQLKRELAVKEAALKRGSATLEDKELLWTAEDEFRLLSAETAKLYTEMLLHLQNAINLDPNNKEAKRALADVYWEKYLEAEKEGREDAKILYRAMLERYHEGRYTKQLAGFGTVEVVSEPDGAEVWVVRLKERKRRLLPVAEAKLLGKTPCKLSLERGYYLISVRKQGFCESRYPIFVERLQEIVIGGKLYSTDNLLPDFVYIPAGEAIIGGDEDGTFGALPRQTAFVKDFCIAKTHITISDYLEFLNDVRQELSDDELFELMPKMFGSDKCFFKRHQDGTVYLPEVDEQGDKWSLQWPVFGITFDNAVSYIEWRSKRDGVEYRLPTEIEWEKAGRGLDGRLFPWGNRFVVDFCNMRYTPNKAGKPQPADVASFNVDCSPYGVFDLAGNVREWCDSWFDKSNGLRSVRGGAWYMYEMFSRLPCRSGEKPFMRSLGIGFRLAYSLPLKRLQV